MANMCDSMRKMCICRDVIDTFVWNWLAFGKSKRCWDHRRMVDHVWGKKKSVYNAEFVIACDVVRIVKACTTEDSDHSWSGSHNDLVVRIEECIFLFMPTVLWPRSGRCQTSFTFFLFSFLCTTTQNHLEHSTTLHMLLIWRTFQTSLVWRSMT